MMPACLEFAWPIDKDAAAEAMVRRHVPGWATGPVTVTAAPNLGLHSSIYFANATSSFSVVARLVDKTHETHCTKWSVCDKAFADASKANCTPRLFFAGALLSLQISLTERRGSHVKADFIEKGGGAALGRLTKCVHGALNISPSSDVVPDKVAPAEAAIVWQVLGGFTERIVREFHNRGDRSPAAADAFLEILGAVTRVPVRSSLRGIVIGHNDLHPGNILEDHGLLLAVDFESVATSPRFLDLAYHLLWADAHPSRETRLTLLKAYGITDLDDGLWDLEVGVAVALLVKVWTRLPRGANTQLGLSNKRRRLPKGASKGPEIAATARVWRALEGAFADSGARSRIINVGVLAFAKNVGVLGGIEDGQQIHSRHELFEAQMRTVRSRSSRDTARQPAPTFGRRPWP